MGFRSLSISSEYRSLTDSIVRDFYIPVLSESVKYRRAVGYFSSTALIEVSRGLAGLVRNGGTIELVASPYLSEEDMEAIHHGYQLREQVLERALLRGLTEPSDSFAERRLNLLANLIAEGKLDIKIAFTENASAIGMYHEKMGLMYDEEDNVIAFSGSMNETGAALFYNYETIDVYCSWTRDDARVRAKESAFLSIWENNEKKVQVIDFPRVKQEILNRYKRGPLDLDVDSMQYGQGHTVTEVHSLDVYTPHGIQLYDYQIGAIERWKANGYRGIFDMATGTGKTLTALGAVSALSTYTHHRLATVIVCPYQHLVEQWVEDIERFGIRPIIGYSSSAQKDWKRRLESAVRDHKLQVRGHESFCFICTNATFASDFVQGQIKRVKGNALLVVDEAHNFGATRLSSMLPHEFPHRLALSATLERHRDEEGTEKLTSYFGNKCIEYPLERAISDGMLTPYKYYPVLVHLSDRELQLYTQLSREIAKCIIVTKTGAKRLSEKGEKLALKRARVVAAAESKLQTLRELMGAYVSDKHILVYCGSASMVVDSDETDIVDTLDLRQIDAVTRVLGDEIGMKVSQFTSKENIEERTVLKKEFAKGENLQALIAIKCLDEGVNIPSIKVAFILASTTNPKEYVQRRGRVLRLAPGKDFAEIYDFITVPRPLDEVSGLTLEEMKRDLSLVKNELARADEFARIAMNAATADVVIRNVRDVYGIDEPESEEGEELTV